jgi:hypothetical protein
MKKIVVRINQKVSENVYNVVVLAHSLDCNINYVNSNPLVAEIYFLNIFEIDKNFEIGKVYLATVLNENPLRIELFCKVKGEVDNIQIINNNK